jgi:eukaryotic-like serine/threonine-protein kinase
VAQPGLAVGNGRYELVAPLDSGGMGQVWRGYDTVLDREVAVKLIRPDVITTGEQADEFAERFRREARITARIRHHGVPQVYDALLEPPFERVYLVMELVHGTPLHAFIDPDHPLPIGWAAAVAAQICTVLSHAHAIPVVHRDLKPDNVLVCADGSIKLLDFGIAAVLRPDITRLTSTGSPIGTSQYMSPEQIQGGQIAPQSDLYALGCLMHELLTGHRLFDGDTEFALWQQHVYQPPTPVRSLRLDVPEPIETLVLHLLAKASDQRPADAYEVYERLLPFLPAPGGPAPETQDAGTGMPDPTLVYRHPNSPLPRQSPRADGPIGAAAAAGPREPGPGGPGVEAPATEPRSALDAARATAGQLAEEGRIAQAAEALEGAIASAGGALGTTHPQVLSARQMRAAILFVGGDYRRALPEFTALATAYTQRSGPSDPQVIECANQAALCLAELGRTTDALREFRRLLALVHDASGDVTDSAIELRRSIGVVLLAEGRIAEAEDVLRVLHADLCLVKGPDHEDAEDIGSLLSRLRLSEA